MVVQVAPVKKNAGETFCSLDFASRVRNVELGQATKKVEAVDSPMKSDVSSSSDHPTFILLLFEISLFSAESNL